MDFDSFEKFSGGRIFSKLHDINQFSLAVEIPKVSWNDDKIASRVIDRLYDNLREVVRASGFYYDNELRPIRRRNEIGVEYVDDRYSFSVRCDDDTIVIDRQGSRLGKFHEWYSALMPSSQGIVTNFAAIIGEEMQRKIDVLRAEYRFRFVLSELQADQTGKPVKNAEVMRKLLKGYPDDNGILTDEPALLATMGRTDYRAHRWIGGETRRRLAKFVVEAPANLAWSTLWLSFSYGAESYTSPDGLLREAFTPEIFLGEYDKAYSLFLRDAALNGFLDWLMRGFHFKSTAGTLP
jgi:hypothetical protein